MSNYNEISDLSVLEGKTIKEAKYGVQSIEFLFEDGSGFDVDIYENENDYEELEIWYAEKAEGDWV